MNTAPHLYHTLNRNHVDAGTARDWRMSQSFATGSVVNIGFLRGLKVLGAHERGGYRLESAKGTLYHFQPHNGISKE